MAENDPLDHLRDKLKSLKAEGQTDVPIDALLRVLKGATPQQLETWMEVCRRERLHYQVQSERSLEMSRSVISAGQAALKSTILVNGGAAVAVLAFVGSLAQRGAPTCGFSAILGCFAAGTLLGAAASGGTYLAQAACADNKMRVARKWNCLNIAVVTLSYIAFLAGCYLASCKF